MDRIATHKIYGYLVALAVIAGLLVWTFTAETYISDWLSNVFGFFQRVDPQVSGTLMSVLWNGVFGGLVAGVTLVVGIFLIFGAARKELILLMAVALFDANLAAVLTPVQLIVLALVGTIYPCFATVGALTKEFGWKSAWAIIGANLAVAILIGGIAAKLLTLVF